MPSLREELSTGCLEAMWAGVPVVMPATGDGRLRAEGIEPVRAGDHAAMAKAIGRFIDEPDLRAQASERASAYARAHGADAMVEATLKAYEGVSGPGRAGR
mgnify:FL=1